MKWHLSANPKDKGHGKSIGKKGEGGRDAKRAKEITKRVRVEDTR